MTTAKNRRSGPVAMAALLMLLLSSCQPCAPIWGPGYPDMGNDAAACGNCANGKNAEFTVKDLAGEIDQLEKHIEKFGSIVPKQTDIWGEARLMLHRQEFEQYMSLDLGAFKESFQASIYRSDQAYLASALSLQAAVSTRRRGSTSNVVPPAGGSTSTVETQGAANNPPAGGGSASNAPSSPPAPQLLYDPNQLISNPDKVIFRTSVRTYQPPGFSPSGVLSLEPTLVEDQKARYLYHLHELRRINESDDNSEAPGYTLNLVRIPISVLAGECTQTGWGGECTVTATPHLPGDLLPQTFRAWVINDLIDSLTLPITKVIETKVADLIKSYNYLQNLELNSSTPNATMLPSGKKEPTAGKAHEQRQMLQSHIQRAISQHLPPIQAGRADQYPVPATQLMDVVGERRLLIIAKGASIVVQDHLAAQSHPYHLDVRAFLQEELSAAYDLLASQKFAGLWKEFCTPVLVEAIHSHDVPTLKMLGDNFRLMAEFQQVNSSDPSADEIAFRRAVKPALAWSILVEAALLNDRLLKDMRATQIAKGCPCVPDGWLPLYGPHPPIEMCQLFNEYVRCRWPLYVFALDPATEDQNVMDQYDMRREMQLALAMAFSSGQIGAGSMTRYVRRIEEDMDTIAINRTMVGFSHGTDTFGWRFYPRVQTPPIPGNLTVIFRDLLWGRRGPRFDLRYRRLENGVRECDALVVMPAIVPYVDMEFTSNWFALANPKCKRLNLKQAMRLSQRVQAIREGSSLTCDTHCYRPGDPALLLRRLEQLSLRLPLQHQLVNVPFENTHGGYEMLATGVSNLAPRLSGWYGAPGIDPTKVTSLFLVGNNFSVTQTRVIVGGQVLTPLMLQPPLPSPYPAVTPPGPPQVELLSRQVIRITIPQGALSQKKTINTFVVSPGSVAPAVSTDEGKPVKLTKELVDVHVATPYGISAPLSVPIIDGPGSGTVHVIDPNNAQLRISYCWGPKELRKVDAEGKIRFNWKPPTGQVNEISIKFTFNDICVTLEKVPGQNGTFDIPSDRFAQKILKALANTQKYSVDKNPLPSPLVSSKIEITPPLPNKPFTISDPVRIDLKLCCDSGS